MAVRTFNATVPALDVLTVGARAGAAGPFLVIENTLHEPELLSREIFERVASEFRTKDLTAFVNAGPRVVWASGSEPLQAYVAEGGILPGISPLEIEFAFAAALRSVRSLLQGWPVHEERAPGYPWVARLCGVDIVSASPRSLAARAVRDAFEPVAEAEYSAGSAVVAFDAQTLDFELGDAPLVWIGSRALADTVEAAVRDRYEDVERFGIAERAPNYGLFPERNADGVNVIIVNSRGQHAGVAEKHAVTSVAGKPFRLLIVARPDRKRYPIGGVETLIQQVSSAMQQRGATVDVQETLTPDARGYDVAHIIGGLADNVIQQSNAVRTSGTPLALTPVFATYDGFEWFTTSSVAAHADARVATQEHLTEAMRKRALIANQLKPAPNAKDFRDLTAMRQGYALADNLFVCAYGEAREIAVRLGVYRPTTLIPNGVDTDVMKPDIPPAPIVPRRPYVLMATRIDLQKNLQGLFDAVRDLPELDVVVLGRIDTDSHQHAGLIMSNATGNVVTLPSVPLQSHPWFGSLFANAAAVLVPSWAEVFSLNVLDAAACARPVIMGHAGYHVELFGDLGYYVDPCDALATRDAIAAAVVEDETTRARRRQLAAHVHETYGWNRVGDLLFNAYRTMAERGPVPLRGI